MMTTKTAARSPKTQAPARVHKAKPQLINLVGGAKDQLEELTGLASDSVSRLSKVEDGWQLVINMVELKRIPASTDMLAIFEVTLDAEGNITGYHRSRRYLRDQIQEDDS
jgi:hypothetical protein|tara:strand:- start:464 stop:793 length:330 start_codon:yes stop_codon:yes gene_type:complete